MPYSMKQGDTVVVFVNAIKVLLFVLLAILPLLAHDMCRWKQYKMLPKLYIVFSSA